MNVNVNNGGVEWSGSTSVELALNQKQVPQKELPLVMT